MGCCSHAHASCLMWMSVETGLFKVGVHGWSSFRVSLCFLGNNGRRVLLPGIAFWDGLASCSITLLSRSTLSLFTQSLTNSPTDLTAFLFRFVTHRDAITIYYVFSLYSVTLLLRATIGDWSSDSMCLCHVVNLNSTDGTHYAQFQLISTRLVVGASIRPLVNNHWELNSNFSLAVLFRWLQLGMWRFTKIKYFRRL